MRFMIAVLLLITPIQAAHAEATARAIFAGGCFWCMEAEFEGTKGVVSVVSGYTGGVSKNPTYREVGSGNSGHAEAVEVRYDADVVSYEALLDIYWSNIDFTDAGGQFADRGSQYRTEIFVLDDVQRTLAEASKAALMKRKNVSVVTQITDAGVFYPAEAYHQNYAKENAVHYNMYKYGSGRVARLKELQQGK